MGDFKLLEPVKVSMKDDPKLNEAWLQDVISENPKILDLGDDLILKDKERIQPSGGRLDLLLQDIYTNKRYEVEIQLGKTDESHIIRTIEYWDIEKKRYPQYEHCAVIIAEEITSRFLNVISLFNGTIPLIAIQATAYKLGDDYFLTFTKILDEVQFGLVDEDEEIRESADREYWTDKGSHETVEIVDEALKLINLIDEKCELKYNKFYIGLTRNNQPDNFIIFKPRKKHTTMEFRLKKDEDLENRIEDSGLQLMDYLPRDGRYRVVLSKDDIKKHEKKLLKLIKLSLGIEALGESETL